MTIEKQAFINWKQHSVTKEVMELMRRARDGHIADLASDAHILNPAYAQLAAKWAGCIAVIDEFLNIRYENMVETEESEDENDN